MSVANGQLANQTTFNTAFVSRTVDTSTVGRVDLNNVLAESGSSITNTQRELNSLASFVGKSTNIAASAIPTWTNNDVGASSDDLKDRAEAITLTFNETTGHTHDGTAGNGGPISAVNLSDYNRFYAEYQYVEVTSASGTSFDVTGDFAGKTSGGDSFTEGVLTDSQFNKTQIISLSTGTFIEDAGGQKVYGRVTEASGVWSLSFYTNESGTETSHSLSTQNIGVFYREVFDQQNRPTIPADVGDIGSLDLTADVVDASNSQRGVVSTGTQSFGGSKTFEDNVRLRGQINFQEIDNSQSGSNVTLTSLSSSVIRVTSGTLVSIGGLQAGSFNQVIALFNATGNDVVIQEDAAVTPADGILTGTGADFSFVADSAVLFIRDVTTSRWRMIGGGGGGSGGGALVVTGTRSSPQSITASGGIAFTGDDPRQLWFISGAASGINDISANPQVASGVSLGQELILVGRSNDNTVLLEDGNGLSLNGSYEMGADSIITLFWDSSVWVELSRRE